MHGPALGLRHTFRGFPDTGGGKARRLRDSTTDLRGVSFKITGFLTAPQLEP